MFNTFFLIWGQMSSPVNNSGGGGGGRCPHIPFFVEGGGANIRGGKCPTLSNSIGKIRLS